MYGEGGYEDELSGQLEAVRREIEELELENSVYEAFLRQNDAGVQAALAREAEKQRSIPVTDNIEFRVYNHIPQNNRRST